MSPVGAIGVNVAIATAAVAAQELYPKPGHGPIAHADLQGVQRLREDDVRMLHRMQLQAQQVIVGQDSNAVMKWLGPKMLPLLLKSPVMPRIQRRIFLVCRCRRSTRRSPSRKRHRQRRKGQAGLHQIRRNRKRDAHHRQRLRDAPDIEQGPDGNRYVVSLTDGVIGKISRADSQAY
jgi:hypothetical protein